MQKQQIRPSKPKKEGWEKCKDIQRTTDQTVDAKYWVGYDEKHMQKTTTKQQQQKQISITIETIWGGLGMMQRYTKTTAMIIGSIYGGLDTMQRFTFIYR